MMQKQDMMKDLTLATIADGGIEEAFQGAVGEVLANVTDLNTDDGAREIRIRIKIKPNENRNAAALAYQVTTKLAVPSPVTTQVFMGYEDGVLVAKEALSQQDLFPNPHGKPASVADGNSAEAVPAVTEGGAS